jgi:hypothetical protein
MKAYGPRHLTPEVTFVDFFQVDSVKVFVGHVLRQQLEVFAQ